MLNHITTVSFLKLVTLNIAELKNSNVTEYTSSANILLHSFFLFLIVSVASSGFKYNSILLIYKRL